MQLVLDSSGQYLVVALGRDGNVVRDLALPGNSSEARDLLAVVNALLGAAHALATDIAQIGCGIGPGSFIGTRAAVCFANGFAAARGLPVHPLPSLQAWAAGQPHACCVLRDARRGEAYLCYGAAGPTELVEVAQLAVHLRSAGSSALVAEQPAQEDRRGQLWLQAVEEASIQAGVSVQWQQHLSPAGLLATSNSVRPQDFAEPLYLRGFL